MTFWLMVRSDAERDALRAQHAWLLEHARWALTVAGYQEETISRVAVAVESQQTVDTAYAGDWRAVMRP